MSPPRKRKKLVSNGVEIQAKLISDKTKLSLEMYAAKILDTVQKARKSSQQSLRKEVQKFCKDLEDTRTNGEDPLRLFPQEIWEIILGSVQDVTDLASCAKSCTLFEIIVNSSAQELLFGKVIPFVCPYFLDEYKDYNVMETLVICGHVCKKWRAGVNSFADNYFRTEKFISNGIDKLRTEPKKYFEDKTMLEKEGFYDSLPISEEEKKEMAQSDDELEDELESNDSEDSDSESDEDEYSESSEDGNENFIPRMYRNKNKKRKKVKPGDFPFLTCKNISSSLTPSKVASLKVYGPLLWSATLDVEQSTLKSASLQEFCTVYSQVLETCPNLTALSLYNPSKAAMIGAGNLETEIMDLLKTTKHPKLECFEAYETNADILPIQNAVLGKLSSILQHVKVYYWNEKTSSLAWDKLTSLEILGGITADVFKALNRLAAPNLHKLYLRLDSSVLDLAQLFKCINQFPNLECLILLLTNAFTKCTHSDIISVPLELLTNNRITTMKIICHDLNVSRDIALLFPVVRKLTLRYGKGLSDSTKESDGDDARGEESPPHAPSVRQKPFIQLYRSRYMYKSNIWSLLPQLQELKLVGGFDSWKQKDCNIERFTRNGYYYETEKYLPLHQAHLKQVWKEADGQIIKNLKQEQKSLNHIVSSIEQKSRLRSRAKVVHQPKGIDDKIYLKVVPFIIPLLAKVDVKNCRLVGKDWWRSIELPDKPVYTFGFPLATKQEKDKFQSNLKKCQAAPFFARNIEIRISKSASTAKHICNMLKSVGKFITQLTVTVEDNVIPDIVDMYQVCVEITHHCPELRSWFFNVPKLNGSSQAAFEKLRKSQNMFILKHLERVSICGPEGKWNSALDMVLKDIGNMCHLHLKSLQQSKPNFDLFLCDKDFIDLGELTVTNFVASEVPYYNYYRINSNAPNLRRLCLCLNVGALTVGDLSSLTSRYKNLKQIELQFGSTYNGLHTNLFYTKPENISMVNTVRIVFTNKYQVSLDFLAHFPFVRNLSITYGNCAQMLNNKRKATQGKEVCTPNQRLPPPRQPEKDFIQLVRYLKDENLKHHDSENIYDSNIWIVLRKLQTLEIVYCPSDKIQDKAVFSRT